jgi:hypothetical protein
MKNGRKIFKFLKFFDSIRGLDNVSKKNKPLFYKVIMFITHTCNFFYYILDHIIWGVNIGALRYKIILLFLKSEILSPSSKTKAKAMKDSFSLAKALLKLVKVYYDYKLIYK